jgi:hypothetical protein
MSGRHILVAVLLSIAAVPLSAQKYTLRGTVVGTGNTPHPVPIAGATIEFAQGGKGRAVTDSLGRFALPEMKRGKYVLVATAQGFAPVTLQADLVADQNIFITMASSQAKAYDLTGTIMERGSQVQPRTLAGATVTLVPGNYIASAGNDGRFSLKSVPAGPYTLAVTAPNHKPTTARFTLSANQVLNITLAIDEAPVVITHSLSGKVVRMVGSVSIPIPGATVLVSPGGYSVDADSSGNFSIPGLPPDVYTVVVRAPGEKTLDRRLSIPTEGEITLIMESE